jgi:hypothetical protein
MESWISEKEAYILPDLKISEITKEKLNLDDLYSIL